MFTFENELSSVISLFLFSGKVYIVFLFQSQRGTAFVFKINLR